MLENFVEKKLELKKKLGVTQSPTTDLMCHNPLRYLKSLKSKKIFAVTKSPTTDLQFESPLRYHQCKNHRKKLMIHAWLFDMDVYRALVWTNHSS